MHPNCGLSEDFDACSAAYGHRGMSKTPVCYRDDAGANPAGWGHLLFVILLLGGCGRDFEPLPPLIQIPSSCAPLSVTGAIDMLTGTTGGTTGPTGASGASGASGMSGATGGSSGSDSSVATTPTTSSAPEAPSGSTTSVTNNYYTTGASGCHE